MNYVGGLISLINRDKLLKYYYISIELSYFNDIITV